MTVRRRGLVIQLLTDKVFFSSGEADLQARGARLVDKIGEIVRDERSHPVVVEGYTDSQPISNGRYQSNWDLSGARAAAVVNDFAQDRRPGQPDVPAGLRQPGPDRQQFHGRRPCEEPTGGDRPLPHLHTSNTDTESTP